MSVLRCMEGCWGKGGLRRALPPQTVGCPPTLPLQRRPLSILMPFSLRKGKAALASVLGEDANASVHEPGTMVHQG